MVDPATLNAAGHFLDGLSVVGGHVPPAAEYPAIEYPADLPAASLMTLARIDAECTRTARQMWPAARYRQLAASSEATGFLRDYNAAIAERLELDPRLEPAFGLLTRYDAADDSRMRVLVGRYMTLVREAAARAKGAA
jgi:hypothetical protein